MDVDKKLLKLKIIEILTYVKLESSNLTARNYWKSIKHICWDQSYFLNINYSVRLYVTQQGKWV